MAADRDNLRDSDHARFAFSLIPRDRSCSVAPTRRTSKPSGVSVDPRACPLPARVLTSGAPNTFSAGHTLLLLDAAEAYHREVLRKPSGSSEAVQQLLPRLRDPLFTMELLVTLPEATPIHEAMQLERDDRVDALIGAGAVRSHLPPPGYSAG